MNGRARTPAAPHGKRFERNNEMTKKLMMVVATLAASFGAWAETETVGGYTWTYQIDGDTAVIYGQRKVNRIFQTSCACASIGMAALSSITDCVSVAGTAAICIVPTCVPNLCQCFGSATSYSCAVTGGQING